MSGPSHRVVFVRDPEGFRALEQPWNRLWSAAPGAEIFQHFSFAQAWVHSHAAAGLLLTAVVQGPQNDIHAVLPLARHDGRIVFVGTGFSDYNDFLVEKPGASAHLALILDALLHEPGWSECVLENVPEHAVLWEAFQQLRQSRGDLFKRMFVHPAALPAPSLVAGPDGSEWQDTIRKESLRRHRRKLEKQGTLAFAHLTDAREIELHLPRFMRQHAQRRGMAGDHSLFLDENAISFYHELIRSMNPARELRFSILTLDDRPIAYHLGFEHCGKYVWYKPAFDVDFWDYSPGEVLLQSILMYASGQGLRELDFTIGDEAFKSRFANVVRHNYTLSFFKQPGAAAAARTCASLTEAVRRRPALLAGVRLARRMVRIVRRKAILSSLESALRRVAEQILRHDHVIVFRRPGECSAISAPVQIEVRPLTLASIAEQALDYENMLTPAALRHFARRLKAGDRGFLAYRNNSLAHVAWLGIRDEIVADYETGPDCRIKLDAPGAVIYDCWTPAPQRGHGVYPAVLRYLCGLAVDEGYTPWIYCAASNHASQAGIRKAGFLPAYQFHRRKVGRGVRSWVSRVN
jgi:CelD/BcsL family acetyltransferase involved in cellulose biosynthesis